MALFRDDLNTQLNNIEVSEIRQFDDATSSIPDILKLTLGEPDFNVPAHVQLAAKQAIDDNFSHYTNNAGIPELRQAAANFQNQKYGLHYQAENVLTTVGASEAIAAALGSILNPGDGVLIPAPIYSAYSPLITLNHGIEVRINTRSNHFVLTPNMIESAIKAHPELQFKAIVLNYPSNPTGVTYRREELADLVAVFKKYNLWVISDEIYSELTYGATHFSIAALIPEQTILISGLSKSHAMTGWRLGFIFAERSLINQIKKVHQYLVTAATSIVQKAAVEALTNGADDGLKMAKQYVERRDFVYQEMTKMGFEIARPDGAFYIFAKIPAQFNQNSMAFCRDLAQKNHLALIPGHAFGDEGEGYVRLSYAANMDKLHEAMKRLQSYIDNPDNQN
ncbi:pyridoxal phosphate-dependent aminotransferase [Paucilactobacillus kaifaensis]|uniref:pyridoxal phosphate-dependent aminotransferase n=1 Tax=Paucilactobacillus kaifaensis TaxID=2559921 RepID=UPI0010F5AE49|nr:pyridoxal phosphate-dependent aminotransferase [Paucilactobacillus kaifaensis]